MMFRQTKLRLFAMALCFVSAVSTTQAIAADAACPQAVCTYLPAVVITQPLTVPNYHVVFRRIDRSSFYYGIQGHVINRSNQPIRGALVTITGGNGFGSFVTDTVPLALPATLPGQLNPFEVSYGQFESSIPIQPKFEISGGTPTNSHQPVTVVTSRTLPTGIEVTFRNDALVPVKDVQAVIGWILPGSPYIDFLRIYPPYFIAGWIDPGGNISYSFPIILAPNTPQQWVVFAQGSTCFTTPLCP